MLRDSPKTLGQRQLPVEPESVGQAAPGSAWTLLNDACIAFHGNEYLLTYTSTGLSVPVSGIMSAAPEAEDEPAAGEGSIYAKFFMRATGADPLPEKGDQVSSATAIYVIVRRLADEADGLWLLLRLESES